MKLKVIFLLFNVVIIGSFLVIFFMPFFVLGSDFSMMFWGKNWYLAVLFLLVLGAFNLFFGRNWRLFSILDKEDWPALKEYLEKMLFEKGRVTGQYIRLYAQACLISGSIMEIRPLEAKVKEKKEKLIEKHALVFGLPYLVEQDAQAMENFFGTYFHGSGKHTPWVRWCHAFSLMLLGKTPEAEEELKNIYTTSRENLLRLLSLYLLSGCGGYLSGDFVNQGKSELRGQCTPADLEAEKRKSSENYLILVLSRLINDAKLWLFPGEAVTTPES